jgi:Flp pilus assembly protein TadG
MFGREAGDRSGDERGMVSSLFVWAIAVFLLIGLTLNEVGQCIVAKSEASNAAEAASESGLDAYRSSHNASRAQTAAIQAATNASPSSHVVGFGVGRDGSVTVTVEVTANTVVVSRFSPLKNLGVQRSTATTTATSGS